MAREHRPAPPPPPPVLAAEPTGWAVPAAPFAPPAAFAGGVSLTEVPGAFLTSVKRGDLASLTTPFRWLRGAVHDDSGRLLPQSQKLGGLFGNPVVPADPPKVPVKKDARLLRGTWLYGGHWIQHFGHFFIDTVTTLWPRDVVVEGIVFHSYVSRFRGVSPWQRELLDLTSYGGLPCEVVEDDPVRVERLLLPSRSVVVNGWAEPEAVGVWSGMAAAAGGRTALDPTGPRLFLSRTPFNAGKRAAGKEVRTTEERDLALDRVFAGAGFDVVVPETLPVPEQVRLAASASVLAGSAGTALHLSAFAPAGVKVLELGDSRSPDVRVPTQLVVDSAREHPTAFVGHEVSPDRLADLLTTLSST